MLHAQRIIHLLAVLLQSVPLLAVAALLIGRIFLGVGESFTATGATLWGIKTVGAIHTSRVISWNGVATYVAMAVGAPLGVMLNGYFGISGFAAVVILVAVVGLLYARTRQDVSVTAGIRAPFHAEQAGLQLNSRELPDHLPLYLEYLSILPENEAREGLQNVAPILAMLGGRLKQRECQYYQLFDALLSIADSKLNSDSVT